MFPATLPIDPVQVLFVLVFCIPLCIIAYWKKVLSWDGTAVAFLVGLIIGVFGNILWLLLLFILLISSFAATRYRFELKVAKGVQEGKRGERRARNVFSHGLVPSVIALLNFFTPSMPFFPERHAWLLYVVAISAAGADAIASELGVLSDRVYLITSFRKVRAGTNGGVSILGTFSALVAAAYISILGWGLLTLEFPTMLDRTYILLIPLTAGFLGCNIDSVIGATLETRGYFGKHATNLVSITLSVLFAWEVLVWLKL